jgi:hypothetical protein
MKCKAHLVDWGADKACWKRGLGLEQLQLVKWKYRFSCLLYTKYQFKNISIFYISVPILKY